MLVCLPDSCLICMVGFEPAELLVVCVWPTLEAPKGELCCSCLGDCCLGNWARIWAGDPTRVFGEGSLAEVTFTPAEAAPATVNTDSETSNVTVWAARTLSCLLLELNDVDDNEDDDLEPEIFLKSWWSS